MSLAVIDFHEVSDPGRAMDASLANIGFMQVRNIGVDPALIARVFAASADFFKGPAPVKAACRYRSAAENFGYQGVADENLDPDAPADLKETFTMRNIVQRPPSADRWPSLEFRDLMQAFYAQALGAAHAMQREMARTLGVREDAFVRAHTGENVTLRLLHYPATGAAAVEPEQMGAGAHTDYGFLTLLFQNGVGGLQVVDASGGWIDVPPLDEAVVVNSGDLLERWTNCRYKSTLHRVLPQVGGRDRLSIAMFIDPDSDTDVTVLPSCVSAENPARFGPVTAGAHLQSKLEASHKGRFES